MDYMARGAVLNKKGGTNVGDRPKRGRTGKDSLRKNKKGRKLTPYPQGGEGSRKRSLKE